jgi:hypothetical protein
MGEAKRKSDNLKSNFMKLDAKFRDDGINTEEFGFYDQHAFTSRERINPEYLDNYTNWVAYRPRTPEYEAHVRSIVPKLAELITSAFEQDNWQGSCVAASIMISRMLDKLGVWSVAIHGSTSLKVKDKNIWRALQIVDHPDFENATLGHSWIFAPPFQVIDSTISLQRWDSDEMKPFIPRFILAEQGRRIEPSVDDVVSAEIQRSYTATTGYIDKNLHHRLEPKIRPMGKIIPSLELQIGGLTARYIPVTGRVSDTPLEEINSAGKIGRTGKEIWEDIIRPAFNQSQ